jgi:hypothetical protein
VPVFGFYTAVFVVVGFWLTILLLLIVAVVEAIAAPILLLFLLVSTLELTDLIFCSSKNNFKVNNF